MVGRASGGAPCGHSLRRAVRKARASGGDRVGALRRHRARRQQPVAEERSVRSKRARGANDASLLQHDLPCACAVPHADKHIGWCARPLRAPRRLRSSRAPGRLGLGFAREIRAALAPDALALRKHAVDVPQRKHVGRAIPAHAHEGHAHEGHAHEESTVQSDWCQGATEVMHGEQRERTLGSGTDIRTRVLFM